MYDAQGNARYHEGRINVGSGVPSGSFRYKIERDLTQQNRWCNFVNSTGAYCITLAGVSDAGGGNYNAAGYITVGIESQATNHTFTNNTKAENVWYYPFGASGYQRLSTMYKADNKATSRPWSSTYTPFNGTTPDIITFKNQ